MKQRLTPFLLAGVGIIVLIFGMMLLVYLVFFGAVIGLFLYIYNRIRLYFSPVKTRKPTKRQAGRIIDSDDWKVL